MQSNKERSAEESYRKFLDIMLYDVPLIQLDELVVNDVAGYGTTLDEKILEIERLRKLVIDQREQGAGYEINFVVNPVHRRINTDNGLAVFIDEIEITMSINGNKNIIPLRFSSVLELINGSWKVVHLHGSVAVNTEGDTWHKEEHLRKIEELEKLVSEKTVDLVKKNKELEIEASLERVRSVAMSMHKSDDLLSICEVSFKEFQKLGFENIRNAIIHIPNDEKGFFMDYDFSEFQGGAIAKIEYGLHPIVDDYLEKIRSAKDAYFEVVIEKNQLEGWKDFRRRSGQKDDPRLDEATAIYYYLFSIGIGDIGISSFKPIDDSQKKILKRFRNVFDLAYRRYNDISLAEAQAREAKIEVALERVRARTMAMQKSDELRDASLVLFQQMKALGEPAEQLTLGIVNEDENVVEVSATLQGNVLSHTFGHSIEEPLMMQKIFKAWKAKKKRLEVKLKGEALKKYNQYRNGLLGSDVFPTNIDPDFYRISYMAFFSKGFLALSTNEPRPAESIQILERFSKAFNLTYTRFLDLQKAEAQAKEAQIELALERVRARTMAMQKSEELKEVIQLVYEQFVQLNIHIEHTGFIMDYKARDDMHIWLADKHEIPTEITIPYFDSPHWNSFIEAKEKGMDFFANHLSFDEKNKFYKDLFKFFPVPDESKEYYFGRPGLAISTVLLENVGLYIENFSGIPYTDEENATLMRFGKVFQQTYTRFLDLKKAEAQAREAQIELALERVRARTMAMHSSQDVGAAVETLYDELENLKTEATTCGIAIIHETGQLETWTVTSRTAIKIPGEKRQLHMGFLDVSMHPFLLSIVEASKNNLPDFSYDLEGESMIAFFKAINDAVNYSGNFDLAALPPKIFNKFFFFREGALFVESLKELSAVSSQIFTRFAAVFGQTYQRYLDLKKAEAQAREAKIETALERVRARTMAMQRSEELSETSVVLFQQFNELGEDPDQLSIGIVNESEKVIEIWLSVQGNIMNKMFKAPIDEPTVINKIYTAWKEKRKSVIIDISGDELEKYNRYRNSNVDFKEYNDVKNETGREETRRIIYTALFSKGLLSIATQEPRTEETIKLLERFASVFDGTYTRFLDLQKAEAQAHEAEIEVALEKVRSRSLAMHKTEELGEVVTVVVEKLRELNIPVNDGVAIVTHIEGSKDQIEWMENPGFSSAIKFYQSYFEHPILVDYWKARNEGIDFIAPRYTAEVSQSFLNHIFEFGDYKNTPQEVKDYCLAAKTYSYSAAFQKNSSIFINDYSGRSLTEQEIDIVKRFSKVFEQAYVRFLDLQKAEAQTREAQIELSLERIRAQVTAMRESSELLDIVVTMRSEFVALGHEAHYFWHMRWLPDRYDKAMTSGDGTRIGMVMTLPRHIHGDVKLVADWEKSDEPTLVFAMDVDTSVEYVEKMITLGDFQQVDPQAPTLDDIRHIGGLTFIMARTTHGEIGFSLPGTVPNPPEESVTALVRFAGVFDLAYRRFEDLKEAEEKNKIIQADNERKTKELEDARQLQISLLPKELPKLPGLEIAAFMRTATEVGGDYYDFIVQKNGFLNIALGDATGHGLQAGTMVTLMKGLFTSNSSQLEPREFMLHCARVIKDIKLGRILMSFIYLRFENSRFIASSAGMPPIYYHHKKSNRTEEIIIQGMPLGAMRNVSYNLVEKQLYSGDTILLLTDGLPEQMNSHKVPFDYSRVRKYFGEIAENTPDEIINSLVQKADEWMNGTAQTDDISFVVIKVK